MTYAMIVPLLTAVHIALARAEIRIEGSALNVRVEARDASVADVLTALARRFGVRVRGTADNRRVSAKLEGSLRQVITRVLDGHNYVIRAYGDALEVMILTAGSPYAVPAPVIAPPSVPAARLRRNE